jgi:energy-coupling factor transport system substrate-specific component
MAAGFIAGIPFDIAHCVGNFFAALILYAPLCRLMKKLV